MAKYDNRRKAVLGLGTAIGLGSMAVSALGSVLGGAASRKAQKEQQEKVDNMNELNRLTADSNLATSALQTNGRLQDQYNQWLNQQYVFRCGGRVRPKADLGGWATALSTIGALGSMASGFIGNGSGAAASAPWGTAPAGTQTIPTLHGGLSVTPSYYKRGGKTKRKHKENIEVENKEIVKLPRGKKPQVTDGGQLVPIGRDMYMALGATHDQLNESGRTGIGINVPNGTQIASNSILSPVGDGRTLAEDITINPTRRNFNDNFRYQEFAKALEGVDSEGNPIARYGKQVGLSNPFRYGKRTRFIAGGPYNTNIVPFVDMTNETLPAFNIIQALLQPYGNGFAKDFYAEKYPNGLLTYGNENPFYRNLNVTPEPTVNPPYLGATETVIPKTRSSIEMPHNYKPSKNTYEDKVNRVTIPTAKDLAGNYNLTDSEIRQLNIILNDGTDQNGLLRLNKNVEQKRTEATKKLMPFSVRINKVRQFSKALGYDFTSSYNEHKKLRTKTNLNNYDLSGFNKTEKNVVTKYLNDEINISEMNKTLGLTTRDAQLKLQDRINKSRIKNNKNSRSVNNTRNDNISSTTQSTDSSVTVSKTNTSESKKSNSKNVSESKKSNSKNVSESKNNNLVNNSSNTNTSTNNAIQQNNVETKSSNNSSNTNTSTNNAIQQNNVETKSSNNSSNYKVSKETSNYIKLLNQMNDPNTRIISANNNYFDESRGKIVLTANGPIQLRPDSYKLGGRTKFFAGGEKNNNISDTVITGHIPSYNRRGTGLYSVDRNLRDIRIPNFTNQLYDYMGNLGQSYTNNFRYQNLPYFVGAEHNNPLAPRGRYVGEYIRSYNPDTKVQPKVNFEDEFNNNRLNIFQQIQDEYNKPWGADFKREDKILAGIGLASSLGSSLSNIFSLKNGKVNYVTPERTIIPGVTIDTRPHYGAALAENDRHRLTNFDNIGRNVASSNTALSDMSNTYAQSQSDRMAIIDKSNTERRDLINKQAELDSQRNLTQGQLDSAWRSKVAEIQNEQQDANQERKIALGNAISGLGNGIYQTMANMIQQGKQTRNERLRRLIQMYTLNPYSFGVTDSDGDIIK